VEAASSAEPLLTRYRSAPRYIPQDGNLQVFAYK